MFATLLGALPRPPIDGATVDDQVRAAVRAQVDAGLEPITEGRLHDPAFERVPAPDEAVERWRSTQAMTERAVKQALPGPYSTGGSVAGADALAEVATALAEAGCPLVEIEEASLHRLADSGELRRFREAHERLLSKVRGTHLSL